MTLKRDSMYFKSIYLLSLLLSKFEQRGISPVLNVFISVEQVSSVVEIKVRVLNWSRVVEGV